MTYKPPLGLALDHFRFVAESVGLSVDDYAAEEVNVLMLRGLSASGQRSDSPEKAVQSFNRLCFAIITAAEKEKSEIVTLKHVKIGLKWICPLFPFC